MEKLEVTKDHEKEDVGRNWRRRRKRKKKNNNKRKIRNGTNMSDRGREGG